MSESGAINPDRLRERIVAMGHTQSSLARKVGVTQAAIAKLLTGKAFGSSHLHKITRELGTTAAYLTGETDDATEGALPMPTAELLSEQLDLVQLPLLDLKFGMGGGTELDPHVEPNMISVSREWVRAFTNTDPKHLFMGTGIGDSMMPTIHDGDLFLGDRSQMTPRMADQVWAITYYGMGMIKRLRPGAEGSFKIMSDNAAVATEVATDGEMSIIGRVVAVMRRI
ncbi:MAG: S24 family peptidase [Asticcacaulis sp.]